MSQAQKEEQFKSYDWSTNAKWQSYLQNVYPVPPMAKLEKMKRKWYKNNVDKEFNPDAQSTATSGSSATGAQQQTNTTSSGSSNGASANANPTYNQYNPFFSGAAPRADVKPEMKGLQFAAWIAFVLAFITGLLSATLVCFIALACGIVRKGGFPKFNMDYVTSVILDENTQCLGLLAIASSSGSFSLICWSPIFLHAALICTWIANDQSHVTAPYTTIINLVKKTGLTDKVAANQSQLWDLRHDVEVYMGVYLTVGILVGVSGILNVLMYWQIMRMRYLMSPANQQAFSRFDVNISELLAKSWCPGFIASLYAKLRGFLKSQIDSTVQQASGNQGGEAPSGITGAFKRATQSCTVF